ncbi:helix-turn-helix domain-containing protein [Embleya sp. NPDC056575]|uniref:helix-turn-helix domain-containing protein n=1 Tax=unclassified Embleya TaxID=2699296 RepID=UPI0036B8D9C7
MQFDALDPIEVPQHVWARPEMREALRTRSLGGVLKVAVKYTGASQTRLANAADLSQAEVSRILSGTRRVTSIDLIERIARALSMPDDARMALGLAPCGPVSAAHPSIAEPEGPEAWELVGTLTRSSIGAEAVLHLEKAALDLSIGYPSAPPGAVLPAVSRQMQRLQAVLQQPQSLRVQRDCTRVMGVLAGLAGNLYLDMGQEWKANSFFDAGKVAGREAEDDALTAWLCTMQSIGAYYGPGSENALALLRQAAGLAQNSANERRRAWISALLARALAANGERGGALSALDHARELLADAAPPSGVDFFDEARLDGFAGSSHLLLNDPETSSQLLLKAIHARARTDHKGRALLTLDLAECRVAEGEFEEAARLLGTALDLSRSSIVRPIVDRVQKVRHALAPRQDLPAVAAVAEQTREEWNA